MLTRFARFVFAVAATTLLLSSPARAGDDGVIRVKSAFPVDETVTSAIRQ